MKLAAIVSKNGYDISGFGQYLVTLLIINTLGG